MEYRFQVGDRVMGTEYALSHRVGKFGRVTRPQGKSSVFVLWDGADQDHFVHKNEIVRIEEEPIYNVKQKPKLKGDSPTSWRDMTPEEKGALLLAEHEGKVIEVYVDNDWLPTKHGPHHWKWNAYRIQPEREMVEAKLCINAYGTSLHMRPDFRDNYYGDDCFYFTLTFDTIDGKPDPTSIKIEEV